MRQAILPRTGMETWQILSDRGARMGHRFKKKYAAVDEVTEEIRGVAAIYRGVAGVQAS